jgi:copper transport protein
VRRRISILLLLLATLIGLGVLGAGSASAHATVAGSTPVDGSRLTAAPTSVEIDFDQAVSIGSNVGYLHVIDESGKRVDTGTTVHPGGDASKISVNLASGLGDGTYTASFRIISADSHPVAGAIRFVVGNGTLSSTFVTPSAVDGATGTVFDVVRWTAFAGFALLAGGWLMFTVWPAGRDDRAARGLVRGGWLVSVLAALAELFVQGPYAAGTGLSRLFSSGLIDATLHTDYGLAHSLRLLALSVLGVVLATLLRRIEATPGRIEQLAGLLLVAIAVTFAASGHAASEHPQWLAMGSDSLHILSMGVWVGGLLVLAAAVLPRGEPDELGQVLPMFSRVAYICVGTLAVTGTYQAFLGVNSWRALLITDYGRLVLLKIALFAVLLGLGNLARTSVQHRLVRVAYAMSDDAVEEVAPHPLRRTVLVELVIAAGVLAATAVLTADPPGAAALDTIDSKPQTVSVRLSSSSDLDVTLSSRRHGPISLDIEPDQGAKPQQLTATAQLPSKDLGPITIPLTATSTGYSAAGVLFPSAGKWTLTFTSTTSQFDSTVADVVVNLH